MHRFLNKHGAPSNIIKYNHSRLASDFVFRFTSVAVINLPPHQCLLLPGGFLLLVPFQTYGIERMMGDLEKAVTDLNGGVTGKGKECQRHPLKT